MVTVSAEVSTEDTVVVLLVVVVVVDPSASVVTAVLLELALLPLVVVVALPGPVPSEFVVFVDVAVETDCTRGLYSENLASPLASMSPVK